MHDDVNLRKILRYFSAILLSGFGLLTLFLGVSVIFDLFGIRVKEGNYVLFVVWANTISSFLYLFSAFGFLRTKSWTWPLLLIASIILITAFIALKIHINNGGIYETRTVGAMIFRISLTILLTLTAYFTIGKKNELKK